MEKISKSQVKLVRSLQQKKFRDELNLFVAEGEKCVSELQKNFELVHLFREGENATRTEIEQMSGLRTPQGVVGVFKKGLYSVSETVCTLSGEAGLILALDGIQDPGNLGTIIRTCDWFGVHDIVCSLDTADCYNPKVVQATMGAVFRKEVHYAPLPEICAQWREAGFPVLGTFLNGENIYQAELPADALVIAGNEGSGISAAVAEQVTGRLTIPAFGGNGAESLNVAAATAIVLSEFRRR